MVAAARAGDAGVFGTASGRRAIGDAEIARVRRWTPSDASTIAIAPERTFKTLKWRDSKPSQRSSTPAWMTWIAGLFTWLAQSARCTWCGPRPPCSSSWSSATSSRRSGPRRHAGGRRAFVAPTHVRDLDIRPESLPDDIGAAARALWDRGEHRAALALLYRGLLSRLAHVSQRADPRFDHGRRLPALTARHLARRRRDYAARLIEWVAAGGLRPRDDRERHGARPVRRVRRGARTSRGSRGSAAMGERRAMKIAALVVG